MSWDLSVFSDDLIHNDPEARAALWGEMLVFTPRGLLGNSLLYVMDLCVQEGRSSIDFLPNHGRSPWV